LEPLPLAVARWGGGVHSTNGPITLLHGQYDPALDWNKNWSYIRLDRRYQ